jgi:iron(III) transport system substrate-binding protein
MKKIRWLSVSLILMFVLIYLAGCGNTQNATSAQPNAAGTAAPATTASTSPTSPTSPTSSTSKEIVLYTAGGFMPELGYAFTAKTGIKVNYVGDSTGNVLAKVQAERNNPHWDLVWFEGAPSMLNLDRQGMLLQKWTPDSAANLTDVGQKDVPSDKAFYPVFASAAGAIAYNTSACGSSSSRVDRFVETRI